MIFMDNDLPPDATPLHKLVYSTRYDPAVEEEYDEDIGYPKPQGWNQFGSKDLPKALWRIQDLVPVQGVTIIAAIAGEGKTWLAMYIAKCISEFTEFLDHFKTIGGRVLYINAEMSESEMQRRGKLLGIDNGNKDLFFLNRDDFNIYAPGTVCETRDYRWLLKYVQQNRIDVVVADTYRAVAGGLKEEKAEEVRASFKKFSVLKNSGVSVIVLDHYRKPSNFEGKIPKKEHLFGSIDKAASAEALLMLRNEGNGEIHVYQRKNRTGKEVDPFAIQMEDYINDLGEPRIRFKYCGPLESKETKKEEAKEAILNILEESGRTRREVLKILQDRKIGEKNVSDALRELEASESIDSIKRGKEKFYFLPQAENGSISEADTLGSIEQGNFFDTS